MYACVCIYIYILSLLKVQGASCVRFVCLLKPFYFFGCFCGVMMDDDLSLSFTRAANRVRPHGG